ncbi:MAG TPA: outer membrane beta-barrel protein [Hyphomicrobium sp.]|nr:outer membrane beta-barrel protein [Hyphomicrobium sp.]
MALTRAIGLSAALLVGGSLAATAADLYGGGMKDEAVAMPMAAPSPSVYFRVDGAWASYGIGDIWIVDQGLVNPPTAFSNNTSDVDDGWSVGGGIGTYFGRGFRGDLTLEYRTSTDISGSMDAVCCTVGSTTDVDGVVGLANLYYDFNRGGRIVPYIGAGIGFAHLETSGGTLGCVVGCGANFGDATYKGGSTTNFAVAGMAGISVKLRGGEPVYAGGIKDGPVMVDSGRGLYLDLGYRFLHLGDVEVANAVQTNGNELRVGFDDLNAHEFRFGLRYDFR